MIDKDLCPQKSMKVIGISGPSGSGKTSLCEALSIHLPNCRIIQQDWYFIDPEFYEPDANFCEHRYLHKDEFVADILTLISGRPVFVPIVDFAFRRLEHKRQINPGSYLLIDGMTIFRMAEIYNLMDYRFYLAPDISLIRQRKLQRDVEDRHKLVNVVLSQLHWVEEEYRKDLESLSSNVRVLRNCEIISDSCNLILKELPV